jgi:hypothetical protein
MFKIFQIIAILLMMAAVFAEEKEEIDPDV